MNSGEKVTKTSKEGAENRASTRPKDDASCPNDSTHSHNSHASRSSSPRPNSSTHSRSSRPRHSPRPTQLSLDQSLPLGSKERTRANSSFKPRASHGGVLGIGKRKTERPFSPKSSIHLVLKSSRAKSSWSMLSRKHRSKITSMVYVYAERYKVHVYKFSNVGNHLHLLVKAREKKHMSDFLRVLAGRIAVTVTGAKKGIKRVGKFWDYLTFSRLIRWGEDFYQTQKYLVANEAEAIPELGKQAREMIRSMKGAMKQTDPPPPDLDEILGWA